MSGTSIRADFGVLDQLAADQSTHAGTVEGYRETLRRHAAQAIANFGGGMGEQEHQACMQQVDRLIDEHIRNTQQFKGSTTQVHETFQQAGQMARSILGSGA